MIIKLSVYQIVILIISLYFIFGATAKYIKKEEGQTFIKFFFAIAVWSGIIIFSIFPNLTRTISLKLGFGENLNTMIFIGFIIVFMIIFRLINIMERIERNISEIVRKEALSKLENKKDEMS